jgi:hypothetical protein
VSKIQELRPKPTFWAKPPRGEGKKLCVGH